jgi:hypothetical protein
VEVTAIKITVTSWVSVELQTLPFRFTSTPTIDFDITTDTTPIEPCDRLLAVMIGGNTEHCPVYVRGGYGHVCIGIILRSITKGRYERIGLVEVASPGVDGDNEDEISKTRKLLTDYIGSLPISKVYIA